MRNNMVLTIQIHPSNLPSKHVSILKNPNCRIPLFFLCILFAILNSKMKIRIPSQEVHVFYIPFLSFVFSTSVFHYVWKKTYIKCYINDFYFSFYYFRCLMLSVHFVLILLQSNSNHLIFYQFAHRLTRPC
ncbi:hypothetical protein EUGRSUZ_C01406 [Eucalyptus grandis]|uniref:Uncharacterized protein n=2 Tax=Eucalyptus grandis TaxID=71139 RepID=A0ACC3LCN9_EUCGR|nr:hypothetical protein EUGRSUZ_C01406 [Eucalyptus grandis]